MDIKTTDRNRITVFVCKLLARNFRLNLPPLGGRGVGDFKVEEVPGVFMG
jgi:hypothetical protein